MGSNVRIRDPKYFGYQSHMLGVQSSDLPSKVLILIKIIVLKFLFGVLDSNLVLKKKKFYVGDSKFLLWVEF